MSHKLASLLLTCAIQHSVNLSVPFFVLLLDAESAFDLALREILVRRLFFGRLIRESVTGISDSPTVLPTVGWQHHGAYQRCARVEQGEPNQGKIKPSSVAAIGGKSYRRREVASQKLLKVAESFGKYVHIQYFDCKLFK